ncbi:MAG TPA: hypothetical protein VFZ40_05455, partial [Pyrinomonadaceae bacterium]
MKKIVYAALAFVALLSMLSWAVYAQKDPRKKASWEYLVVSSSQPEFRDPAAGLNRLGAQGWELVSVG